MEKGANQAYHGDIDGDGREDTVSVIPEDDNLSRIVVNTSTGHRAEVEHESNHYTPEKQITAVAAVDGAPGLEIIAEHPQGAHTFWYSVYTWRGGQLVAQPNPVPADNDEPERWFTDSTDAHGYKVYDDAGVRKIDRLALMRGGAGGSGSLSGERTTLEWRNGTWKKTKSVQLNGDAANTVATDEWGWHGIVEIEN